MADYDNVSWVPNETPFDKRYLTLKYNEFEHTDRDFEHTLLLKARLIFLYEKNFATALLGQFPKP